MFKQIVLMAVVTSFVAFSFATDTKVDEKTMLVQTDATVKATSVTFKIDTYVSRKAQLVNTRARIIEDKDRQIAAIDSEIAVMDAWIARFKAVGIEPKADDKVTTISE